MAKLSEAQATDLANSNILSEKKITELKESGFIANKKRGNKHYFRTAQGKFVTFQCYWQGMGDSTPSKAMEECKEEVLTIVGKYSKPTKTTKTNS
jgi:hypothetical protein|tara:strand:+ start:2143 stop:2427 length:285 start_codon:yes stop_codon:yes gene_type:complete